jgi:hypothetical protein
MLFLSIHFPSKQRFYFILSYYILLIILHSVFLYYFGNYESAVLTFSLLALPVII